MYTKTLPHDLIWLKILNKKGMVGLNRESPANRSQSYSSLGHATSIAVSCPRRDTEVVLQSGLNAVGLRSDGVRRLGNKTPEPQEMLGFVFISPFTINTPIQSVARPVLFQSTKTSFILTAPCETRNLVKSFPAHENFPKTNYNDGSIKPCSF